MEASVLIRAICSIKTPSLVFEDVARFMSLLNDLFPGISITPTQNSQLEEAILQAAEEFGLKLSSSQVGLFDVICASVPACSLVDVHITTDGTCHLPSLLLLWHLAYTPLL
jgi:hypothetical protein